MTQLVQKLISTIKGTSICSFEVQSCWPIGFRCFWEVPKRKSGWLMATPNPISVPQRSKRAPKNQDTSWPHPLKIFVKTVMVSQDQISKSKRCPFEPMPGLKLPRFWWLVVSIPSVCHSKLCWNTSSRALQWSTSGETSGPGRWFFRHAERWWTMGFHKYPSIPMMVQQNDTETYLTYIFVSNHSGADGHPNTTPDHRPWENNNSNNNNNNNNTCYSEFWTCKNPSIFPGAMGFYPTRLI